MYCPYVLRSTWWDSLAGGWATEWPQYTTDTDEDLKDIEEWVSEQRHQVWLRFFPCFFLSCKENARVKFAKTGHGPHSSQLVICVVLLLFVFCCYLCCSVICVVLLLFVFCCYLCSVVICVPLLFVLVCYLCCSVVICVLLLFVLFCCYLCCSVVICVFYLICVVLCIVCV